MSYNYTIRYRKFNQLLDDVQVDFQNLALQNQIEPAQLIKVAKRINYDLGLRVMQTKETLLEVEKGRVKLPDDFFVLNFALKCHHHTDHVVFPQGTHIEERRVIPEYKETQAYISPCTDGKVNCQVCQTETCGCGQCNTCSSRPCGCNGQPQVRTACSSQQYNPLVPFGDSCIKPRVFMNCKQECYELVQIVNTTQTNFYRELRPIKILENAESVDCGCANLYIRCHDTAWIKDGWLCTNFDHHGSHKVYINYQGMMEDEDGDLLVPDHDMINEYYEYGIKKRILENLIMNDETVSQAKIQLIEQGYRTSRNYALSIVNTPNFSEMKRVWELNRKAQYSKYYDMFKSYSSFDYGYNRGLNNGVGVNNNNLAF